MLRWHATMLSMLLMTSFNIAAGSIRDIPSGTVGRGVRAAVCLKGACVCLALKGSTDAVMSIFLQVGVSESILRVLLPKAPLRVDENT